MMAKNGNFLPLKPISSSRNCLDVNFFVQKFGRLNIGEQNIKKLNQENLGNLRYKPKKSLKFRLFRFSNKF